MKPLVVPMLMVLALLSGSCTETTSVYGLPPGWDPALVTEVQWQLKSFETVAGVRVTLHPNDTILLVLHADSTLGGYSSGFCYNSYLGMYRSEPGGALVFGPMLSTQGACAVGRYWPYLSALEEVTALRYDGRRLLLLRNGSLPPLVFERRH